MERTDRKERGLTPSEANDQTNSVPVNDEGKSEEFLNFERGMKHVLGLSKEQVKDVIRRSPENEKTRKKKSS